MTAVFLGQPGMGNLRGEQSFPHASRAALADAQLRSNIGHATATIRTKRLAAVAECDDWEQLRAAGSPIALGVGFACYVSVVDTSAERATVTVEADGSIGVRCGTFSHTSWFSLRMSRCKPPSTATWPPML